MKIWLCLFVTTLIFMFLQLFINQSADFTIYNFVYSFIKTVICSCVCFSVFGLIFKRDILQILLNKSKNKDLADIIKSNKNIADYEKRIISEFLLNQSFKEKIYTFLKSNKIMEFQK